MVLLDRRRYSRIGVYLYKSLYVTTGLYTVFLFMAISGYFVWRKSLIQNVIVEPWYDSWPNTWQICALHKGHQIVIEKASLKQTTLSL